MRSNIEVSGIHDEALHFKQDLERSTREGLMGAAERVVIEATHQNMQRQIELLVSGQAPVNVVLST